jgi:hypothetical protein
MSAPQLPQGIMVTLRPQLGQKLTARLSGSFASQWMHFSGATGTAAPAEASMFLAIASAETAPSTRATASGRTVTVALDWPGMPESQD